jgi:hypothetical protein
MAVKLFIPLLLASFLSIKCYAQKDKYAAFVEYLNNNCKAPPSVINLCGWQLAMVKLTTNNAGRVVSYSLLNQTSDSLRLMFKPLLGYLFPVKLKMLNKSFVFAYTFYNLRNNCIKNDLPEIQKMFETTYTCFIKQLKANPKTIFYEGTFGSESLDNSAH